MLESWIHLEGSYFPNRYGKSYINEGDDIEMYVDDNGNVVLDKYIPRCVFCDVSKSEVIGIKGKIICSDCPGEM